VIREYKILNL